MPTVARIEGVRFFFFSNEGHEPPHVHVEAGEKYAKFWLEPVALARSVGFPAYEIGRLRTVVSGNAQLFKDKWNEHSKI
ncbi:MAG: DUF4160 domain-containing protein [Nitrospirae bacterium]|nr:DUF4160 domain-containing protein [Nitrospirota bacterium]